MEENINVQSLLKEYNLDMNFLQDLIERLDRMGNKETLNLVKNPSKIRTVLEIYTKSPENWTEEDKFIATSNFIEYGHQPNY